METLPALKDQDSSWAMKVEDPKEDSDDSTSLHGPAQDRVKGESSSHSLLPPVENPISIQPTETTAKPVARARKHSLPLSAKILVMESSPNHIGVSDSIEHRPKDKLKLLVNISNQFLQTDPTSLAQEISRLESKFFLQIEVGAIPSSISCLLPLTV